MNYQKIAIVGKSSSGKTTLAKEISASTGLPLFHADDLIWSSDLTPISSEIYLPKHNEIISKDKWIIEGHVDEQMIDRLKLANIIIYLDYSNFHCFFALIKRWLFYREINKNRQNIIFKKEKIDFVHLIRVLFDLERPELELVVSKIDQSKLIRVNSFSKGSSLFLKQSF